MGILLIKSENILVRITHNSLCIVCMVTCTCNLHVNALKTYRSAQVFIHLCAQDSEDVSQKIGKDWTFLEEVIGDLTRALRRTDRQTDRQTDRWTDGQHYSLSCAAVYFCDATKKMYTINNYSLFGVSGPLGKRPPLALPHSITVIALGFLQEITRHICHQ